MQTTSKTGVALIEKWEGYHTKQADGTYAAYLDKLVRKELRSPGFAGLWTIGPGCTGPHVTKGTVWTYKQCRAELMRLIGNHEKVVHGLIKVSLNQNQFDALVSLSYNLGLHKATTLVNLVNQEKWDEAAKAFHLYNKAGGKRIQGLVNRRADEARLFDTYTAEEVKEKSSTLKVLSRIRNWLVGLPAVFFGGEWISDVWGTGKEFFMEIRTVADNHKLWVAAGAVGAVIGLFRYIEYKRVKEAQEGTYIPGGDTNNDVGA